MEQNENQAIEAPAIQMNEIVQKYFLIKDVTMGTRNDAWLYRYRGGLKSADSVTTYEELKAQLSPFKLKPLFRLENKDQVIYLVTDQPPLPPVNSKVNLLLFIITLLSVWLTGGLMSMESLPTGINWTTIKSILWDGWPFAISLIVILGAHEMGHYLVGRHHKVNVTLPYFIPLPVISPFGTMGAFINMRSIPKNKRQLFDIGIAGPLSGLVFAIPILWLGLQLSKLQPLPTVIGSDYALQLEGNSVLYLLMKYFSFGQLLPQPSTYGNLSPFLFWIRYFFTGHPLPLGGLDVTLHPVAWAGWAGLLVTSLNLLPIGQLDGGHVLSAIVGKNSRKVFNVLLVLLVVLGFAWNGWWLWAALLFFLNRIPSQVEDEITQLDPRRKVIAVLMLIVFILVFIPVPLIILT